MIINNLYYCLLGIFPTRLRPGARVTTTELADLRGVVQGGWRWWSTGRRRTRPYGPDLGPLGPIWVGAGRLVLLGTLQLEERKRVQGIAASRPACCSVAASFTGPFWDRPDPIRTGVLLWGLYRPARPGRI